MHVFAQICILFAICVAAEGLAAILPFTFPSSVLGMLILLALLLCKVLKPKQLQETSNFFLDNMPFFFVPTCVGILKYTDVLFQNFWAIVLISLLTTPLVFFVTGHVVQFAMKKMKQKGEEQR